MRRRIWSKRAKEADSEVSEASEGPGVDLE